MNIVRRLQRFNASRDPVRLQLKYQAMRASAFVFLRGTCHLYYDRLFAGGIFRSAPPVWCCGDLHLENFGSYKGDNGLAYFDINDFDEGLLAPASWDLVRLLSSVWIGAETLSIEPKTAEVLCRGFVDAYAAALASGKARWVERETATGLIGDLLEGLRERTHEMFLDSRSEVIGKGRHARRRLRLDNGKALAATEAQREAVAEFIQRFAATQPEPAFYEVIDVANRIAGTGSLGVERYAVLVRGKGSPHGNVLLDLKRAMPSSVAPHVRLAQPRWKSEGQRSVELQQRMQAVSMAFLHPVSMRRRSFVLRALQPSEDRVRLDGENQSVEQMQAVLQTMGRIVAWAQLRSAGRSGSAPADALIAFAAGRKWQAALGAAAHEAASQVEADWATYCAAYDRGEFAEG